jgi:hypothetical protein
MNIMTIRWIAVTAFLAAGAALVKGATDASTKPPSGEIHSEKDEMSIKGDKWKDNSTTASPSASTGTIVHISKEKMSLKGNKWKAKSTTASPSISTRAAVSPSPR